MTTRVVLFNGPPNSGKDTAAELVVQAFYGAHHLEFKRVLHNQCREYYGIDEETWNRFTLRENKEVPQPELGGISPRAAMIHVSEDVIKAKHGPDYFAQRTAEDLIPNVINAISDCGFQAEVDTMINRVGADNVLIIRLHRQKCTFQGDSRNYVYSTRCSATDLPNDESKDHLAMALVSTIAGWIQPDT